MERNVFHINPPTDENTEYVLLVQRGSSPFGATPPIVFAIDGLSLLTGPDQKHVAMQGFVRNEDGSGRVVIQFPIDTQYIMVERKNVTMLTEIEAAKIVEADQAEFKAAMPNYGRKQTEHGALDFGPQDTATEVIEVKGPGQYL